MLRDCRVAYGEIVVDVRCSHLTVDRDEFYDVAPCGVGECAEQLLAHNASLVSSMDKLLSDYLIKT